MSSAFYRSGISWENFFSPLAKTPAQKSSSDVKWVSCSRIKGQLNSIFPSSSTYFYLVWTYVNFHSFHVTQKMKNYLFFSFFLPLGFKNMRLTTLFIHWLWESFSLFLLPFLVSLSGWKFCVAARSSTLCKLIDWNAKTLYSYFDLLLPLSIILIN